MKRHRCKIGNEQEFKGRRGFVSAAAGMKTDSATAAHAKQSSLGRQVGPPWAGRVVLQVL